MENDPEFTEYFGQNGIFRPVSDQSKTVEYRIMSSGFRSVLADAAVCAASLTVWHVTSYEPWFWYACAMYILMLADILINWTKTKEKKNDK